MAGSSLCPCASCYSAAPRTTPQVVSKPATRPAETPRKKDYAGALFKGRLRRTSSLQSMASDRVGLFSEVQPVPESEGK
ncbi:hypothetical protein QBC34DRAFT_390536 [Podospora aff. communis PSN243]|uniref:Uncharacterized protein n=1 Tax=Podospora aff. communis PSN243 TaxID=3040156 RepID=A0AAV9H5B5_9PEZI|nr:hypothetical protein QBC34DRAFT_390536 [Podospora aff. communis PSN243]